MFSIRTFRKFVVDKITRLDKRGHKYAPRERISVYLKWELTDKEKKQVVSRKQAERYFKRMRVSKKAQVVFFRLFDTSMKYGVNYSPKVFYSRIWHEGTKKALKEYTYKYNNLLKGLVDEMQKERMIVGLYSKQWFVELPIKVQMYYIDAIKRAEYQYEIWQIKGELYSFVNKKNFNII